MKNSTIQVSFSVRREGDMLPSFDRAFSSLRKKGASSHLSNQFVSDLKLAYAEGVGNAIRHARELEKNKKVDVKIELTAKGITLFITDHGPGFNVTKVKAPDFKNMLESGRGVFLMRQLVDTVHYKKSKKGNVLTLSRAFIGLDPKLRDLNFILEMSSRLLSTEDPSMIYQLILERAADVFGALKASILLYDASARKLKLAASRGLSKVGSVEVRPGEGIAGYVFKHQKPCLIADIKKNQSGWEKKKKYKTHSFISAPLFYHAPETKQLESVGVINMTDRRDGKAFTKKDLLLLTAIANQAAACLYLKNLLVRATEAESLKHEFEIAGKIHEHYLPRAFPPFPDLEVHGQCDTALEIGGDYYDVIRLNDEETVLVMADVSGHNLAASLTMANFRSQMKAILLQEKKPEKILSLLNTSLYNDLYKSDQFITMVLAVYHHSYATLSVASAGHFFPLIKRDGKVWPIAGYEEAGVALGIVPSEEYKAIEIVLRKQDSVLFYTDGIIECANGHNERYGLNRLASSFQLSSFDHASHNVEYLMESSKQFSLGQKRADDASALIMTLK
ncbi:SpoIIE family protein phosphatase [bacterium]|nr:SpoIIE family protein phosphatase [bacterium]